MKKKVFVLFLILCLSITMLSIVHAQDPEAGLLFDSDAPTFDNTTKEWSITGGNHTVTGTAIKNEYIKITGDTTLTLDNCTIEKDSDLDCSSPAISIESGSVNLVLNGSNTLKGDLGFAGIYVAEGASLTVSGSGRLTAKGGDGRPNGVLPASIQTPTDTNGSNSGAAGIGGNGIWLDNTSDHRPIPGYTPGFGTITINSGNITSTGGAARTANDGAGAGIGTGGGPRYVSDNRTLNGTININGGTVQAIGGEGERYTLSLGGAGIGTGGISGPSYIYLNNNLTINLTGGTVTATGTADGAGIGGGCNMEGGIINISGGNITATGGYEEGDMYGGAGIGGGDNAGVRAINITGGTVVAKAIGSAAGIGGGNDGFVGYEDDTIDEKVYGKIIISGNADVTAIGGSCDAYEQGGAGIGSGTSYYDDQGFGEISIIENAKVRAYAGVYAQAIGTGSWYEGDAPNKIHFGEDSIDVWMFTPTEESRAFWGQNDDADAVTDDYSSDGAIAVWYTTPEGATYPAEESENDAYDDSTEDAYTWNYSGKTIMVLSEGEEVASETYRSDYSAKNWATFAKQPRITISYGFANDDFPDGVTVPSDETITKGTAYTAKGLETIPDGYTFDGWYTDEACTTRFVDGTVLNESISLYGKLIKDAEPEEDVPDEDEPEEQGQAGEEQKESKNSKGVLTGDRIVYYSAMLIVTLAVLTITRKLKN